MLPRLSIAFILLSSLVGVSACSSAGVGQALNVGPNFPTNSFYATNSNQNGISIFTVSQKGGAPTYTIGGSSTGLDGPQYIAFDKKNDLWITNYNKQSTVSRIIEIEALATGNVIPLANLPVAGRVRGIAIDSTSSTLIFADVIPTSSLPNQIQFFTVGGQTAYQELAGAKTLLDVPSGVAFDTLGRVYVTNLQGTAGGSVERFVIPTPTPTPTGSPTASPSPTPTPTPTPSSSPSSSPSPTPTPTPTATPLNIRPSYIIQGPNTGIVTPTGITVASNGDVFVSDQGNIALGQPPEILVFHPNKRGIVTSPPERRICGPKSLLNAPTDVKLDTSNLIYVADTTKSGSGVLYVYSAAGAAGNKPRCTGAQDVAPTIIYTSPGAVTGIGLVP